MVIDQTNTISGTRSRLYNSTGFFFLLWAAHYVPFFIMGRQLFLHHYLPAHLASALVAGAVIEFVFNIEPSELVNLNIKDGSNKSTTKAQRSRPIRERIAGQSLLATWVATGVVVAALAWGFIFFAPLTYGNRGLSVEEITRRKWLGYDLHFAK